MSTVTAQPAILTKPWGEFTLDLGSDHETARFYIKPKSMSLLPVSGLVTTEIRLKPDMDQTTLSKATLDLHVADDQWLQTIYRGLFGPKLVKEVVITLRAEGLTVLVEWKAGTQGYGLDYVKSGIFDEFATAFQDASGYL